MQFVSHNEPYGGRHGPSSVPSCHSPAAVGAAIEVSAIVCQAQSLPTHGRMSPDVPVIGRGPSVDGHPIQPRADESRERHSQPDVSDRDARELDKSY
jgi:hypothetical protein